MGVDAAVVVKCYFCCCSSPISASIAIIAAPAVCGCSLARFKSRREEENPFIPVKGALWTSLYMKKNLPLLRTAAVTR